MNRLLQYGLLALCIIGIGVHQANAQDWVADSLGTYTLFGTVVNENSSPIKDANVILDSWPHNPRTFTDGSGKFALRFQVDRDHFAYNMQAHIRITLPESEQIIARATIPIRQFEGGMCTLPPIKPGGELIESDLSLNGESNVRALKDQIKSLKSAMQKYPERVDSLKRAVEELRSQLANQEPVTSQTEPNTQTAAQRRYVVKRGDSLSQIAAEPSVYGDAELWEMIYSTNREIIKDPDLIYPNQILIIPPRDF